MKTFMTNCLSLSNRLGYEINYCIRYTSLQLTPHHVMSLKKSHTTSPNCRHRLLKSGNISSPLASKRFCIKVWYISFMTVMPYMPAYMNYCLGIAIMVAVLSAAEVVATLSATSAQFWPSFSNHVPFSVNEELICKDTKKRAFETEVFMLSLGSRGRSRSLGLEV